MLVSSRFSHGQGAAPAFNDLRGDDVARERLPQSPRREEHGLVVVGPARTALELAVWSSGASERMRTTMKERPPAVHGGCVTHTERAVGPGPLVSTSEGPSRASMVCVSQEAGGQKRSRVGSPELSFCGA